MKPFCIPIIILIPLIFTSCSGISHNDKRDNPNYKNISPEEAKKKLQNEKDIILLDVRNPDEYAEKHIPNSILIPLDKLKMEATNKLPNKDVPIIVYCRSGRRSATAANILIELGYKNVYDLGGIINWPYETI